MATTYAKQELKLSISQIDFVLDNPDSEGFAIEGPSRHGNDRLMLVGWDQFGNLIEVGIEYTNDTDEHIFHAMSATLAWQDAFNQRKRRHGR